jgi:two-component system, LytTR family, response regulator
MINAIILDDEQHSIELIEYYARKIPHLNIVAGYEDPRQALEKVTAAAPVDLIFLDIFIPYMTAAQFMKALPYQPQVILTTAYTNVKVEELGDKVVDYLIKPFAFETFEKAVAKVKV